jgi:chromatin remodeling complex protein RSC6
MTKRKTSRRKSKRKTTRRKSKRKTTRKKSKSKKNLPFGGYGIDFTNRHETLEEVFGKKPVTPSEMTKLIWQYIKRKRIASKP